MTRATIHPAISEPESAAHLDVDAMLIGSRGVDTYRLRAERPANAIHRIAADIEQTAAPEFFLHANVGRIQRWQGKCERSAHPAHLANGSAVEELTQPGRARVVRPHEAVHEVHSFCPAPIKHLLGFDGRGGKRLLAEDVLAALGGLHRPFGMQRVGEGIINSIDG